MSRHSYSSLKRTSLIHGYYFLSSLLFSLLTRTTALTSPYNCSLIPFGQSANLNTSFVSLKSLDTASPPTINLTFPSPKKFSSTSETITLLWQHCSPLQFGANKTSSEYASICNGSWACQITTNWKDSVGRIIDVKSLSLSPPVPDFVADPPSSTGLSLMYGTGLRIHFHCDSKASTSTSPIFQSAGNESIQVDWTTPAACPFQTNPQNNSSSNGTHTDNDSSDSNTGGGSWFWFLILLAGPIYAIGGCLYNYHILEIRTWPEVFPHYPFWSWMAVKVGDWWEDGPFNRTGYVRM